MPREVVISILSDKVHEPSPSFLLLSRQTRGVALEKRLKSSSSCTGSTIMYNKLERIGYFACMTGNTGNVPNNVENTIGKPLLRANLEVKLPT